MLDELESIWTGNCSGGFGYTRATMRTTARMLNKNPLHLKTSLADVELERPILSMVTVLVCTFVELEHEAYGADGTHDHRRALGTERRSWCTKVDHKSASNLL